MSEKKRKMLSLKDKLNLIAEKNKGVTQGHLARKYGLSKSTICGIMGQAEKLTAAAANHTFPLKTKRLRKSKYDKVDKALFEWFVRIRKTGMPLTAHRLLAQAEFFGRKLGVEAFKPTATWVSRFKQRHNIVSNIKAQPTDAAAPSTLNCEFVATESESICGTSKLWTKFCVLF